MKQYILSDGRPKWVSPENEQAFFEQLKKQGLTATPKSEEVGKSKGTNQSQNNQQKNFQNDHKYLSIARYVTQQQTKQMPCRREPK